MSGPCDASDTLRAKVQHFRRELAKAVEQLPTGVPSAVHLGFEAYDGEGVEAIRYKRLKEEMMTGFNPGTKELEVVYCHLFEFESTPTENWAVNETCNHCLRNRSSRGSTCWSRHYSLQKPEHKDWLTCRPTIQRILTADYVDFYCCLPVACPGGSLDPPCLHL